MPRITDSSSSNLMHKGECVCSVENFKYCGYCRFVDNLKNKIIHKAWITLKNRVTHTIHNTTTNFFNFLKKRKLDTLHNRTQSSQRKTKI